MDDADGASVPKRGRPSLYDGKTTRIRLTLEVFDVWKTVKEEEGFGSKTHGEFAESLLRIFGERRAVATHVDVASPQATETLDTGIYCIYCILRVCYLMLIQTQNCSLYVFFSTFDPEPCNRYWNCAHAVNTNTS